MGADQVQLSGPQFTHLPNGANSSMCTNLPIAPHVKANAETKGVLSII